MQVRRSRVQRPPPRDRGPGSHATRVPDRSRDGTSLTGQPLGVGPVDVARKSWVSFMTDAASSDASDAAGETHSAVKSHERRPPGRSLREMRRSAATRQEPRRRSHTRGQLPDQRRGHFRSSLRTRRLRTLSRCAPYDRGVPRTFPHCPSTSQPDVIFPPGEVAALRGPSVGRFPDRVTDRQ